jgi:hypothetical protein
MSSLIGQNLRVAHCGMPSSLLNLASFFAFHFCIEEAYLVIFFNYLVWTLSEYLCLLSLPP